MTIRPLAAADRAQWLRLRRALWPDLGDDAAEADAWLARADAVTLVAVRADGRTLAGFAEAGERAYADGCDSSPVAFLEGWFVAADLRRQGVGAALVTAVEDWARARGLGELASDSRLEELDAQRAHRAVGFVEVERAVRYRKPL